MEDSREDKANEQHKNLVWVIEGKLHFDSVGNDQREMTEQKRECKTTNKYQQKKKRRSCQ